MRTPKLCGRGVLAAAVLAALAAPAAGGVELGVPNGDFSLGRVNWDAQGWAGVAEGRGHVGQAGCLGDGPGASAVVGRLATVAPVPLRAATHLVFDYRIATADVAPHDALRVVAIGPDETRTGLAQLNPNRHPGVCGHFTGTMRVALPPLAVPAPGHAPPLGSGSARLEFHVWQDGDARLFLAQVDNVRLELAG